MNRIDDKMIRVNPAGVEKSLEDFISGELTYPISMFGNGTVNNNSLSAAVDFLTLRGYGNVEIPKNNVGDYLKITARYRINSDMQKVVVINYVVYDHRPPLQDEKRPYSGENWVAGDMVINTNLEMNHCMAWVCKEGGNPGIWGQYGSLKPFYTHVETLDELPDPNELQHGRQILLSGEVEALYVCKRVGSRYSWCQQDIAIGNSGSKPTNPENGFWYLNTSTGYPEWYDETNNKWRQVYDVDAFNEYFESKMDGIDDAIRRANLASSGVEGTITNLNGIIESARLEMQGLYEEMLELNSSMRTNIKAGNAYSLDVLNVDGGNAFSVDIEKYLCGSASVS